MEEFSITQQEYEKFQADYTFNVIKNPTYRYGQAFLNYFYPDAGEYLISISNLGGAPAGAHPPNLDSILWSEKSYHKAKDMIEDHIEIK